MSDQPSPASSILQRLRWKAILLGFVVDYAGSVTYGLIAGIVVGILHVSQGGDPADAQQAIFGSTPFMTTGLVVGSLFVVVGGFVIGRLAPQARLLNGAALGVLDILLGLTYREEMPAWFDTAALLVTLPCALLGAWLAGVLFPSHEAEPPPLPPSA